MVAAIAAANGSLQLWAVLFVGGGCDRRRQRGLCAWTVCRAQSRHVGQLGKRRQRRWLDEAEGFFQDWGATAVVVGRWLPLARFTVALPAGINRMPWRRFVIWNALGGISWVPRSALPPFFSARRQKSTIEALGLVGPLASALPLTGHIYRCRRREATA